jgi:peptide/nickel transport system permease protein
MADGVFGSGLRRAELGRQRVSVALRPARARRARGVVLLVFGALLLAFALIVIENALLAVGVSLVALGIAFRGLDDVCQSVVPGIDTGFWVCAVWLVLLVLAATFAGLLPLADYQDPAKAIMNPGYAVPNLFSAHPLGTDGLSLDLLARCIYGARVSLLTGGLAVAVSVAVGVPIGTLAGYRRGWVDKVCTVFTDTLLTVPALLLLIALAAALGAPTSVADAVLKEGIGLAIVTIPTTVRLARASTLKLASSDFVFASRALGATTTRVVVQELIPSVLLSVTAYAFVLAAVLIVTEGSLSFLGLGLQPPHPTWGNMMAEGGITDLSLHPYVILIPGVFLFLTVFSLNRVGERAHRAWGVDRLTGNR